jgi:hypothetical protein
VCLFERIDEMETIPGPVEEPTPIDFWHGILKWIDHNRWVVLGMVLTVMILLHAGCQSKTASIFNPDQEVTRQQLNAEGDRAQAEIDVLWATLEVKMDTYSSALEAGHDDLDAKDEKKAQVSAFLGGLATSAVEGTFNPLQAVTSGVSLAALLVGGGAMLDNRRKDKIIRNS